MNILVESAADVTSNLFARTSIFAGSVVHDTVDILEGATTYALDLATDAVNDAYDLVTDLFRECLCHGSVALVSLSRICSVSAFDSSALQEDVPRSFFTVYHPKDLFRDSFLLYMMRVHSC